MTDNEIIERNRAVMRRFEKCINTNDLELGRRLISDTARFMTPVSPSYESRKVIFSCRPPKSLSESIAYSVSRYFSFHAVNE